MSKAIVTVGQLRGLTATARAVDRVKVLVYLSNTRGPVECYIAGHLLRAPKTEADNELTLQVRPVSVADAPEEVNIDANDSGVLQSDGPAG